MTDAELLVYLRRLQVATLGDLCSILGELEGVPGPEARALRCYVRRVLVRRDLPSSVARPTVCARVRPVPGLSSFHELGPRA